MRSEVFKSTYILLKSSHSQSFFRLTLICTLYFSRKKCGEKKKKKVNSEVYTFIYLSQLKHYFPNSDIRNTAFEQPKVSLTIGRKRIVGLEIHGKIVYRSGKEKVTTFCLLPPYILLSLQTNKNIIRLCLAFQGLTMILHGPIEDCQCIILKDQKMLWLVKFLNSHFQNTNSNCTKENICILIFLHL